MADCVGVAFPNLHQDLLKNKILLMGCPKFDDSSSYIKKFEEIFKNSNIKSITAAIMEVPCCSGFSFIIQKGLEKADKKIPVKQIVVNAKGEIISET